MRAGYDRVRQPERARGGIIRQHRCLRHLSAENQHHQHRSSGGQAGGYLKFTNGSRTVCRMSGWPVVIALTATGGATRLRHAQSTMFGAWHYTSPPPVITLRPGDSAYAVIAADDNPAGGNTSCPAPYVRLQVSPPGDSGNVTISAWLPGAGSYLPACTSADGSPTAGTSTITTLSSLPH